MDAVLTEEQGQRLLQVARQTIAAELGTEKDVSRPRDPAMDERYGTFVTLKSKGELRGCIGNLTAVGSVLDGVKRNAANAAFHDSRFRPLTVDELEDIQIDISVLSPPEPLEYSDGDDLIRKLRPGVDGVILTLGNAGATFLPQVWDQLPDPGTFLGHLCQKAGLPRDAWQTGHPVIEIYQVQCFEEDGT